MMKAVPMLLLDRVFESFDRFVKEWEVRAKQWLVEGMRHRDGIDLVLPISMSTVCPCDDICWTESSLNALPSLMSNALAQFEQSEY
jgi:hypothetical protein